MRRASLSSDKFCLSLDRKRRDECMTESFQWPCYEHIE